MNITPRTLAIGGAVLALGIGSGVAVAQIPATDGTISGCYVKSTGTIRVIDAPSKACKSNETLLQWNQQGNPGTDGTNGTDGAAGTNGTDGTDGVSGYEVVSASGSETITSITVGTTGIVERVDCPTGKVVLGGFAQATIIPGGGGPIRPADVAGMDTYTFDGISRVQASFVKRDGTDYVLGDVLQWGVKATCATAN